MLASALKSAFDRTPRLKHRENLEPDAATLMRWSWQRRKSESHRLLSTGPVIQPVTPMLESLQLELTHALEQGRCICEHYQRLYTAPSEQTAHMDAMKIGFGSPGYTGCTNVEGSSIAWDKFNNPHHGSDV